MATDIGLRSEEEESGLGPLRRLRGLTSVSCILAALRSRSSLEWAVSSGDEEEDDARSLLAWEGIRSGEGRSLRARDMDMAEADEIMLTRKETLDSLPITSCQLR